MEIPEVARRLLESATPATLVTLNDDGSPHATVAWVGLDCEEVVIGTLPDQRKLTNIRRDPRVVLTLVTDRTNPMGLTEYLVVYGRGRVTEGGAPEVLQRLAQTYLGPDVPFPPMPDPPPGYVTRIEVDRIGGVGAWVPTS